MASPDPIGPDLIGAALAAASDGQLAHALNRLPQISDGRDPFAHAARDALDRHLPELIQRAVSSAGSGDELSEALRFAIAVLQPGAGAIAALPDLPEATGRIAELVILVLLIAARQLEETAADGTAETLSELAHTHGRLARAFDAQGQRQQAIAAGRRAVQIHRQLVEQHGQTYVDGLAIALNNLAVNLHGAGQAEESLTASEQAAVLFRRLAGMGRETHRDRLANALANLAVSLAEAGREDEALAAIEEAVGLLRALADAGAEVQADLAWVLHNLSVRLAAVGRDVEAVDAVEEAVGIRRRLSRSGQHRHLAALASSLNNCSVRLNAVGRHAEALAATEEAIRIRRELAAADPDRYLPALATSLNNLSVDVHQAGRPPSDALAATAEAVQIRRNLAQAQPDIFRPALAAALHNMSIDLAATGQDGPALDAIEEAVAVRRSLAASRPQLYWAELASSLRILAIRLADAGRPAVAVDAARESTDIFRSLTERQPSRFRPELARSLSTMSNQLGTVGRYQEALAAVEECVQLRRELAASAPDVHLPELAIALNNMSVELSRAGQAQQALAAAEEALQVRRTLAAARPDQYAVDLAASLNNLAVGLDDAGRHPEALTSFQEAVQLLKKSAPSDPRVLPDLVMSLNNLSRQLDRLGRRAEAGQLFAQLLTGHQHDAWATGVILRGQASWSAEGRDIAGAIAAAVKAIDLLETDPAEQARARRLLRSLRNTDPGRFDLAWDSARGNQPVWLRHLEHDRLITDQIDRWIASPTLDEEEAFLVAHSELVSEQAEAALDHLIDDNPGHGGLRAYRDIIRAARAGSAQDAYAELRRQLWHDAVTEALTTWTAAAEEELQGILAEERVLLLSEEAEVQAEDMLASSTRTPGLIWRVGLLILCRCDGVEAAFQASRDQAVLHRSPGKRALTDFKPRDLALARLRFGHDPDDPEAAFIHAVLALVAGRAREADEAITRCAETSTSWDRRTRASHLTELTVIRPDLSDALSRLRSILATSGTRVPGGQP